MELSTALKSVIDEALATSTQFDLAQQVGVLFVAIVVAFVAKARWNRAAERRIAGSEVPMSRTVALRGSKRLAFALTVAVIILLAYGVFELLGRPTGLFDLAGPLAVVLAAVRILVFLLRIAAGPVGGTRGMELFFSILLWVGCALYLIGWLPAVEELLDGVALNLGETRVSLFGILKFLVISVLLVMTAMALSRVAEGRLSVKQGLDSGVRMGLVKVIRYLLVGFAVLVALSAAGFDLTTLTVIGGTLGVGIGFGLQKVASNLVSGFLILFDRSIRPGDVISIGDSYGWVEKISARYLVVRDRSGVDTLIPNEELITTQVINWSYGDRHIRLKLPVQISYGDDPELAMQLLMEATSANDRVIADPAPAARLMGFGDNGIDLELRVWIDDPEQGVANVRSDINLAIWRAFKTHGISIPFPQRDLHVKQTDLVVADIERQVS